MHLYFLTRGVKHFRDVFVTMMQSQMWKWTRKNLKTGKDEVVQVQGALRPIELWEYVFPEECLDEVLTVLKAKDTVNILGARGAALRKALGKDVKKVPEYKEIPTNKFVEATAVAVYPIGIKKDPRGAKEEWGYEQELL